MRPAGTTDIRSCKRFGSELVSRRPLHLFRVSTLRKWQTWRIGADGGQQPTQVTYLSGLYAMESRDGKWLYYSRIDSRETTGVWRRPASYGKEGNEAVESPGELVAPMTFRSTATWVVRDNNLYFSQFSPGPERKASGSGVF